jgi:hypothetical protein
MSVNKNSLEKVKTLLLTKNETNNKPTNKEKENLINISNKTSNENEMSVSSSNETIHIQLRFQPFMTRPLSNSYVQNCN